MKVQKLWMFTVSAMMLATACTKNNNNTFNQQVQNEYDDQLIQSYLTKNGISATRDTILSNIPGDTAYLYYRIDSVGSGDSIALNDTLTVQYTGSFPDGTIFSQTTTNTPVSLVLSGTIAGWQIALQKINAGGAMDIYIPSVLAYGYYGYPPTIPSNQVLFYNVSVQKVGKP